MGCPGTCRFPRRVAFALFYSVDDNRPNSGRPVFSEVVSVVAVASEDEVVQVVTVVESWKEGISTFVFLRLPQPFYTDSGGRDLDGPKDSRDLKQAQHEGHDEDLHRHNTITRE